MTWIRWEVETPHSDVVRDLAAALKVTPVAALGHYTALVCAVGTYQQDGRLAAVDDATLELWGMWRGKRGAFAAAVRARCQDDGGVLRGWWRQSSLISKRERDKIRAKDARESARQSRDYRARIQTPTEETEDTDGTTPPPPAPVAGRSDAFAALCLRVQNPTAFTAERDAMLAGMPGHVAATAEQIDRATADLLANTAEGQPISLRAFRRFVETEAGFRPPTGRRRAGGTIIDFDPARAY